jgi:hypothetical protein
VAAPEARRRIQQRLEAASRHSSRCTFPVQGSDGGLGLALHAGSGKPGSGMVSNPFEPPRPDTLPPAEIDLRRGGTAFGAWLLGASLVAGALTALQTGYALRAFSAGSHVSGVLALAAFRVHAAHVAATAASVAIVVGMRPPSSAAAQRHVPLWLFQVAVPLATPLAACTMILAGIGVGTLAYDLSAHTSWESLLKIARLDDMLHGIALACAYALVLGTISAIVDPRRLPMGGRLIVRILVAVIATGLVTSLVDGALNAALS